jgi:hypothetical protein
MDIIVYHDKVRIVRLNGFYVVQERVGSSWDRVPYGNAWFAFDGNVLDEFKRALLRVCK